MSLGSGRAAACVTVEEGGLSGGEGEPRCGSMWLPTRGELRCCLMSGSCAYSSFVLWDELTRVRFSVFPLRFSWMKPHISKQKCSNRPLISQSHWNKFTFSKQV